VNLGTEEENVNKKREKGRRGMKDKK